MSNWQHKAEAGAKIGVGLLGMAWGVTSAVAHVAGGLASGRAGTILHGLSHGTHQVKHAAHLFAEGVEDLTD